MPFEISTITVTVHEKKAHPTQHGHYDCEITLTGTGFGNQDVGSAALVQLRALAHDHVKEQIAAWLTQTEIEKRQEDLITKLEHSLKWAHDRCRDIRRELDPDRLRRFEPWMDKDTLTSLDTHVASLQDLLARIRPRSANLLARDVAEAVADLQQTKTACQAYFDSLPAEPEPTEDPDDPAK